MGFNLGSAFSLAAQSVVSCGGHNLKKTTLPSPRHDNDLKADELLHPGCILEGLSLPISKTSKPGSVSVHASTTCSNDELAGFGIQPLAP